MADSPISSLPAVQNLPNGQPDIGTTDLFVLEQNNTAKKLTGEQITKFVDRNVVSYEGEIVPSDASGGARYRNGTLTLVLPHGPGIDSVTKTSTRAATDQEISDNDATVDTYTITSQPVRTTNGLTPGTAVGTFQVYNGKNGTGIVEKVMGKGPDTSGNVTKATLMDLIYPVGSIYMTTDSRNPLQILGVGTWTQIKDCVLLAAGDTYTAGATGGTAENTVDFSNGAAKIGYGNNPYNYIAIDGTGESFTDISHVGQISANWTDSIPSGLQTNGAGMAALTGTQTLNNLPPYTAVYIWERTA